MGDALWRFQLGCLRSGRPQKRPFTTLGRRISPASISKGALTLQPSFRPYRPADQDSCLAIFDTNCPAFFAPNERADYLTFLQDDPAGYEVCLLDGRLAGAFGLYPYAPGEGRLKWILLLPQMQGRGLGSAIMTYVLKKVRTSGMHVLRIAASHKSAPFFARFGAEAVAETPDGWGPGMHRIDMELRP